MTTNTNPGAMPEASNPNIITQPGETPKAQSPAVVFVSALHNSHEGLIHYDLHGEIVRSGDSDFIMQHEGELRVCAGDKERSYFVFGVLENSDRDGWKERELKPTAAIYKNGISIFCWALETPVQADDPRIVALMVRFEMVSIDEAVPLPGTDGWELVHADPETYYHPDTLAEFYLEENPIEAVPEEEDASPMYGDAKIITPYNEADYEGRLITVTIGPNQFSKAWKPQQLPLTGLIHQFTKHQIGPKDGLAVVLADMVPGQRIKKAVKTCTAIGLDIDNGVPAKVIDAALAKLNCLAIRATTHSNGKTSSEISKDEILKYHEGSEEITTEMIRQFLLMKKHWDEAIVDTIEFVEEDHTDKGIVCRIAHAPMEKHRVILPLEEPYVIADEGRTQMEAMAKWAKVPAALAELLGVPFDRSCTDPSRLYYLARHDKGRPFSISLFGGPLFRREALQLESTFDKLEAEFAKSGKSRSVTPAGKKLGKWWITYAHGFQIMDVIDHHCPDKKRSKASAGYNIECPFDSDHSNAGDTSDQACFAVNAAETGGNEFYLVKCQHAGCQDKTALDMLGKMIEDQWFPEAEITNPDFNIAEIEDAENPKVASGPKGAEEDVLVRIANSGKPLSSDDIKKIIKILAALDDDILLLSAKQALKKKTGYDKKDIDGLLRKERGSSRDAEPKADVDAKGRLVFQYSGELDHVDACDAIMAQMLRWNEAEPAVGRMKRKPRFTNLFDEITVLSERADGPVFSQPEERAFSASLIKIFLVQKVTEAGPGVRENVHKDIGSQVFHTGWEALPPCPEIMRSPFLSPSGELITKPDWYDPEPGLKDGVYLDLGSLVIPPLQSEPDEEEVAKAMKWVHDLLDEFHFCDLAEDGSTSREASFANAFAMVLTPFARRYITTCTPLFSIEKPDAGVGATLLSMLPTMIFEGRVSATTTFPRSDEEFDKVMVAKYKEGTGVIRFDNVVTLISRILKTVLTAPELEGRVLGKSLIYKRENNLLWISTGIMPLVDKEIARRLCVIRLDPGVEDPQTLEYTRDLSKWVPKHRPKLVWAILTLINNWVAKGMPRPKKPSLDSFEDWAEVIGGILQTSGVEGFLKNPRSVDAGSDSAELREFAYVLFQTWGLVLPNFKDLAEWATAENGPNFSLVRGYGVAEKKQSFRDALNRLQGRPFKFMEPDPASNFDGFVRFMISANKGITTYQWMKAKKDE